jgi:hypothetical protein
MRWDFNDDINVIRQVLTRTNAVKIHGGNAPNFKIDIPKLFGH